MNIEEFKASVPIIQYVKNIYSDILPIVRESNGKAFCRCIWHEDDTPSLVFFADTNKYKCFGCGEHGDIIDLVKYVEKVDWKEAVQIIAQNTGQVVNIGNPSSDTRHKMQCEEYKNMMCKHAVRYMENLKANEQAMAYLTQTRKLSLETIDTFRLGLTSQEEYKFRSDIGNISNKISIPIMETKMNAKCIGFAYNDMFNNKPKYINDHNQDGRNGQNPDIAGVFIKGNILFGYPLAKQSANKIGRVFLCEGYYDVMSMYSSGIKNIVASMGTGFTQEQINLMKTLSNDIVLMYDMDNAGKQASMKNAIALYGAGHNVYVCLYDAHDPDDLAKKFNNDGNWIIDHINSHLVNGIDYIIRNLTENYHSIVSKERESILCTAEMWYNLLPEGLKKQEFKHKLFAELGI